MMTINRGVFLPPFEVAFRPEWKCPICEKAQMELEVESIAGMMDADSKELQEAKQHYNPELLNFNFSARLKCVNPKCSETVFMIGEYNLEPVMDIDDVRGPFEHDDYRHLYPKFFWPSLKIIKLPQKCPQEISTEINRAFTLYWVDKTACVNKMRIALER